MERSKIALSINSFTLFMHILVKKHVVNFLLGVLINFKSALTIDEIGYVKLNESQANLFFQLINKKYEIGSVIIASNLSTLW